MSSLLNPSPRQPQRSDWAARLIPGTASAFHTNGKKRPLSVGAGLHPLAEPATGPLATATPAVNLFALLLPAPLKKLWAGSWLSAMATDFVLAWVVWLLVVAGFLQLHRLFAQAQLFDLPAEATVRQVLGIALLHATLTTLLGYTEGLYSRSGEWRQRATALGKAAFWATVILAVALRLLGASAISNSEVCAAGALQFAALLAWRRGTLTTAWLGAEGGRHARNTLIVGAGAVGRRVASNLEAHPESGRTICGFLDDKLPLGNRVIGRVNDLAQVARTGFVDEIILAAPHDRYMIQRVLREARRLRLDVKLVPDLFGGKPEVNEMEQFGDLPAFCLHGEPSPAIGLFVKRMLDLVVAGVAIILMSPVLGLIAGLIKLESSGPAFYSAQRVGRKGRLFRCYKFRTMVRNADELKVSLRQHNQKSGPFFKIAGDPRITRLGRFLRRYSLDELPQLWNVLKGEMSLVGPRPERPELIRNFKHDIPHYHARHTVKPGITGWAQVNGLRGDTDLTQRISHDLYYVEHWNPLFDLQVMLLTFIKNKNAI